MQQWNEKHAADVFFNERGPRRELIIKMMKCQGYIPFVEMEARLLVFLIANLKVLSRPQHEP